MKAKLISIMALTIFAIFLSGCSSQNSESVENYRISEADDKLVFVFPYTQSDDDAVNVIAQSLSDEESMTVIFENNDGVFLANLDVGTYEIEVSCIGYETATRILEVDDNSLYILGVELEIEE